MRRFISDLIGNFLFIFKIEILMLDLVFFSTHDRCGFIQIKRSILTQIRQILLKQVL